MYVQKHVNVLKNYFILTQNPERHLLVIQRGLVLLKNHLEAFRKRYAYHLRNWHIEGKGIRSHQRNIQDKQSTPLRLVLQPAGMADKVGRGGTQTLCIVHICLQGNVCLHYILPHFSPSLSVGKLEVN